MKLECRNLDGENFGFILPIPFYKFSDLFRFLTTRSCQWGRKGTTVLVEMLDWQKQGGAAVDAILTLAPQKATTGAANNFCLSKATSSLWRRPQFLCWVGGGANIVLILKKLWGVRNRCGHLWTQSTVGNTHRLKEQVVRKDPDTTAVHLSRMSNQRLAAT